MNVSWPVLCSATLCATATLAEDSVAVHRARYEVVLNDPACNGPHERLIRIKLDVPNLQPVKQPLPRCEVEIRKGGQKVEPRPIPCVGAASAPIVETVAPETEPLSLSATLDLCQGLWDVSATIPSAELAGTVGGTEVGSVSVGAVWANVEQKHESSPNKDVIRVALDCTENRVSQTAPPLEFRAYFRLVEAADTACAGEDCIEVLKVPKAGFWVQTSVSGSCAALEGAP
jgi:hypothetical protein